MESKQRARRKHNDRSSAEGREAHRAEEADRRARRARDAVGDHRCGDVAGGVEGSVLAAEQVATEASDARPDPAVVCETVEVQEELEPVQWVLVAWPEELSAARRRLGTEARCPFCGRRGRIVRVVSIDEWNHHLRRGVGWT